MIGLEGATCNTALIPEMEEIGANILLAEHIGRALVVGSEPADRLDVDVPGPLGKAGKPHVVDHTLTQRGHGRSPFGFKRQDLCPGTDQIPQHAVLNDYAFYGEAVQSNLRRSIEMLSDDIKTGVHTTSGRVWRGPTNWPCGVRCIGGVTLIWALVRNLRTWPAMPREKAQAENPRG